MTSKQKQKLILDFMNGPLREYLEGEISFGRFKEKINEVCGTEFSYSDIYPSYLFNAKLSYEDEIKIMEEDIKAMDDYNKKISECHAYGLCATGSPYDFPCATCPSRVR